MSIDQIKARSRAQLGGNLFCSQWLMGVVASFIFSAILGSCARGGFLFLLLFGPMNYGLSRVFLRQWRQGGSIQIGSLFSGFSDDLGQTFLLGLMSTLLCILWSLLLVVPGIIKAYAYSMAFYLKADNPSWDWRLCLSESEQMMKGRKMDLFFLDLSFIGWYILGSLAFGIGTMWVAPYHDTARAGFYDSIR